MRIKRDYSHLPIEEQIKKINFKIKFLLIFSFIWGVFVIIASVLIWVFTPIWELAVGFLIMLPFSIGLGGYWQIKECKDEIKRLREKGEQNKQNSTNC